MGRWGRSALIPIPICCGGGAPGQGLETRSFFRRLLALPPPDQCHLPAPPTPCAAASKPGCRYGDGSVRLTVEENVIVPNVPEAKLAQLQADPLFSQRFPISGGEMPPAAKGGRQQQALHMPQTASFPSCHPMHWKHSWPPQLYTPPCPPPPPTPPRPDSPATLTTHQNPPTPSPCPLPPSGNLLRGLVSCTGAQFCSLALIETKNRALELVRQLEVQLEVPSLVRIHWTGCPNSCGQVGGRPRGGRGG
jgi:hypothetical protein